MKAQIKKYLLMAVTAVNMKEASLWHEQTINKDIRLKYNSRSLRDESLGIGWSMEYNLQKLQALGYRFLLSPQSRYLRAISFKNQELVSFEYQGNQLTGLNYANNHYQYSYDEFSNLIEIRKNKKILHKITYDNEHDWVVEIRSHNNCLRQFVYNKNLEGSPRLISSQVTKLCPQQKIETQLFQFLKKSKLASEGD